MDKPIMRIPNENLQIFCQFENPKLRAEIEKFVSGIGTFYGSYDFSWRISWSPSTPVQTLGYYLFFGKPFSSDLTEMALRASSPFRNGELIQELATLNRGYILIIDRNYIELSTWEKYVTYCDKYSWSINWIIIDKLRELAIPKAN